MTTKTRLQVRRLLSRVIKLQEKAPEGIHYDFQYSGHINCVEFSKWRKGEDGYENLKRCHCYPGEALGITLDEFAEQIAIEEEAVRDEVAL